MFNDCDDMLLPIDLKFSEITRMTTGLDLDMTDSQSDVVRQEYVTYLDTKMLTILSFDNWLKASGHTVSDN